MRGAVYMESLKLFSYSRTSTLILLKKLDEKVWDKQPSGFSNTIRWNAGHVYSTAEDFLADADAQFKNPLPDWDQLFLDGTRPADWPEDVPSAKEIIQALDRKSTRLNSSHVATSYAVFCLINKKHGRR